MTLYPKIDPNLVPGVDYTIEYDKIYPTESQLREHLARRVAYNTSILKRAREIAQAYALVITKDEHGNARLDNAAFTYLEAIMSDDASNSYKFAPPPESPLDHLEIEPRTNRRFFTNEIKTLTPTGVAKRMGTVDANGVVDTVMW